MILGGDRIDLAIGLVQKFVLLALDIGPRAADLASRLDDMTPQMQRPSQNTVSGS